MDIFLELHMVQPGAKTNPVHSMFILYQKTLIKKCPFPASPLNVGCYFRQVPY